MTLCVCVCVCVPFLIAGQSGIPKPWYFLVSRSYWCGTTAPASAVHPDLLKNPGVQSGTYRPHGCALILPDIPFTTNAAPVLARSQRLEPLLGSST